jgi:ElaB/YqjD/DUF883 family membrane-anchored ribosome-binding protein
MADTPNGETVTPAALSNEPSTPAAPATDNSGQADVEQAKREAEQARLRANQLQNELDKIKQSQSDAQQKQLLEKEEFKTLYEQTQSRLKEIEDAQSAKERQSELSTATEAVFKDFPANVVEVAKTAGLGLSDDSEAAQAVLKDKLATIQKQVGSSTPAPTSNNPHNPGPQAQSRQELVQRGNVWEGSPMAHASARGDETVIKKYISDLPAIARMKEIAQNGM